MQILLINSHNYRRGDERGKRKERGRGGEGEGGGGRGGAGGGEQHVAFI